MARAKIFSISCCLMFSHSHTLKLSSYGQSTREEPAEVWISSFPRSASSTLLSMMRVSVPEEDVFTLFEPCHHDDIIDWQTTRNSGAIDCPKLVEKLASCDFTGVKDLWGWIDQHTTNSDTNYSQELASETCSKARLRAFKLVGDSEHYDAGRLLENMLWVLDERPNMKIINLVRDPRAILTSWKSTNSFTSKLEEREVPLWREMCETYEANLKVKDSRVLTVLFEEIVKAPEESMRTIYNFLGLDFGSEQQNWVATNFPATNHDCPNGYTYKFSDCQGQKEAREEMNSWREVLSAEDKENFATYGPCQQVIKAFGYPEA